jgi:hypothetical protein
MKALTARFSIMLGMLIVGGLHLSGILSAADNPYALQAGDIVFCGNAGPQADAIREATDSPFTHCGILFLQQGRLMVLEAVQPVSVSTLERFIARGSPGTFHAKRLKTALTREAFDRASQWAATLTGRDYDPMFRWDDEKLYCSELVWKVYQHAGVELCPRRHFRDYHLDRPAVTKIITSRYGSADKLPADEWVVAPADIAASPLLTEVPKS